MSWFSKFLPIGQEAPRSGPDFGFHVLKNTNPALPIEPWFDFICGINGRLIEDSNSYLFTQEVHNCAGRDIALTVWSSKGQRLRELILPVPTPPTLNLTLQWASLAAVDSVWHILDIAPDSPADLSGLLPYSDYIIGSPHGPLSGESALGELVEHAVGSPITLYVYNNEYNVTRELTITPARNWGGEGMLGCVLGFGALHRIPAPLDEPMQAPGETLFEHGFNEKEMFPPTEPGGLVTPAREGGESPYRFTPFEESKAPGPPPPPPMGAPKPYVPKEKKKRHHGNVDMDALLEEGEKKSRELEGNGGPTGSKGLPPPPKGGPPRRGTPPVASPPQSATPVQEEGGEVGDEKTPAQEEDGEVGGETTPTQDKQEGALDWVQ